MKKSPQKAMFAQQTFTGRKRRLAPVNNDTSMHQPYITFILMRYRSIDEGLLYKVGDTETLEDKSYTCTVLGESKGGGVG